jgi:DnaK suppressor protein
VNHLSPAQVSELGDELSRQLERLERSMRVTEEAMAPVMLDQAAVGRLSRIDSLQNQGLTRNLQERERVKLAHIQGALRRLEQGTYGLCVDCGEAIPFGRLYVVPEVPACASCSDAA